MNKVGDNVKTPNGIGVIKDIEYFSRVDGGTNRYGVDLENNPFFYPIAYYWPHEIISIAKAS